MTSKKHFTLIGLIAGAIVAFDLGCSSNEGGGENNSKDGGPSTGGAANEGGGGGGHSGGASSGGQSGGGGGANSGGAKASGGANSGGVKASGGASSGGTRGDGGENSSGGAKSTGGAGGSKPLPPDPCIAANSCPPGTWINVNPPGAEVPDFGAGPIVKDPLRPSDLYMGGGGDGLWKSTDYGNTWSQINDTLGYVPMGYVMAVLPATPAIIYAAGYKVNRRSKDGGKTFVEIPFEFPDSLYSIEVDPYDPTHLISGLHEIDGIVESNDSGDTWHYVGKSGFPGGGASWYVFFVDTGAAASTRGTWFAIAQNAGSPVITRNGGDSWTIPGGLNGLTHAHGNAQIFQTGDTFFVPGIGGPGDGLYKSTNGGNSFTKVRGGGLSIAWGTQKNVYTMWGWACNDCDLGASFAVAPLPAGTQFTTPDVPDALNIGANHIAVTSDGTHDIFVGTFWSTGVWRYVEP